MRFRRLFLLSSLACRVAGAQSSAVATPTRDSTVARLDAYLTPLVRAHEFSGSVLVRRQGQPVIAKSYGMANREFGVPNGPDTRFLIGSISKQFTAAAVLLLEQQGKLKTSDHLDRFVSGFPDGDRITLLQMLTHTSGISRDLLDPAQASVGHTSAELVELIRRQPLAFEPGSKSGYSNNAYRILAYVVERVSNQPLGAYLARSFFEPLHMTNTGEATPLTLVPRLASGYAPGFGPESFAPSPHLDISNAHGSASIYSTPADLAEWSERFLIGGALYPAVRDRMLGGDGIGVGVATRAGRRVVSHDGVYQGFTSFMATWPNDHLTVVYLGNTETAASVAPLQLALTAIATGSAPVPAPMLVPRGGDVPLEALDDYVGTFQFFPGLEATIKRQGRALLLGVGEGDYPLEWRSADRMFFRLKYADLHFKRDQAGRVTSFDWSEGGQTYPATRVH